MNMDAGFIKSASIPERLRAGNISPRIKVRREESTREEGCMPARQF